MADQTLIYVAQPLSTGKVFYRAPLGTTAPTDATTSLNAAFLDHGWVLDEGFTDSPKRTIKKFYGFGGQLIRTTQQRYEETWMLTLCESNINVLKTVFGDANVTQTTSGHRKTTINHASAPLPQSSFVMDYIDGQKTKRIYIPLGQVTEIGDVKYAHDELVCFKITIDCYVPVGATSSVTEFEDEGDVTA
jgi:hypothetical protein